MRIIAIASLALLAMLATGAANTIYVDVAGSGDYDNIKEAIAAADTGDTVLVAPGLYQGELNRVIEFYGKNIVLMSESGALQTTIDGAGVHVGFYINSGEDSTCVIKGFTVTNCHRSSGGGMAIYHASPKIEDCIFTGNTATSGAALFIRYVESTPIFDNCVFSDNHSTGEGGVGYVRSLAFPTFRNCVFAGNSCGGGGGALRITVNSNATVKYCTFYGNYDPSLGSTIYDTGAGLSVSNCIFSFGGTGRPVVCASSTPCLITHCVSFGHTEHDSLWGSSSDNLYVDPLLCNILEDNFTLCSNSPCVFTNNAWGERVGAYASGCGECGAPAEDSSWGVIKSLFE